MHDSEQVEAGNRTWPSFFSRTDSGFTAICSCSNYAAHPRYSAITREGNSVVSQPSMGAFRDLGATLTLHVFLGPS